MDLTFEMLLLIELDGAPGHDAAILAKLEIQVVCLSPSDMERQQIHPK